MLATLREIKNTVPGAASDNFHSLEIVQFRILCRAGERDRERRFTMPLSPVVTSPGLRSYVERRNPILLKFPLPMERNPQQLYNSIKTYLLWRSGSEWRRGRWNDPEYAWYMGGLNTLNQAWHAPEARRA